MGQGGREGRVPSALSPLPAQGGSSRIPFIDTVGWRGRVSCHPQKFIHLSGALHLSLERQMGEKGVFWGKEHVLLSRGGWLPVCCGLGPGSGTAGSDAPDLPSEWHGLVGSARIPCQLPGRGGEENPAPAMGFSGHH